MSAVGSDIVGHLASHEGLEVALGLGSSANHAVMNLYISLCVGLSELRSDLILNQFESHLDDRGVMMIALPDAFLPACVVSAEM